MFEIRMSITRKLHTLVWRGCHKQIYDPRSEKNYGGACNEFENVLLEKYQNAKNFEEKGTYAFLLKLNEDPTNSMVKSLNEELPELPSFEIPSSWLGDDTLSMKSYFYDDESWYEQTIDLLRN